MRSSAKARISEKIANVERILFECLIFHAYILSYVQKLNLKQEILKYLVKRDNMHWKYWEHHLLYLKKEHAESYLKAMEKQILQGGFHNDTVEIIKKQCRRNFC